MKKQKRKYYCRFCNTSFDTFYMAEICFALDMKILENEKPEANQKLEKLPKKKHIQ